jgi:hypothetical protein
LLLPQPTKAMSASARLEIRIPLRIRPTPFGRTH